jgi:hypothetical protein
LSLCLFVYLSVYLPPACLSVCVPDLSNVYLSDCVSINLSVCLSFVLFVCLR